VRAAADPLGGTVPGKKSVTVGAVYEKKGERPEETWEETVTSTGREAPVCSGSVHVTRVSDDHTKLPQTCPPTVTDITPLPDPKYDPLIVRVAPDAGDSVCGSSCDTDGAVYAKICGEAEDVCPDTVSTSARLFPTPFGTTHVTSVFDTHAVETQSVDPTDATIVATGVLKP
jgi:hypothetical protein